MLMIECPIQTFARFFYNLSSSLLLFFIFFHFTSIFLAKLFTFFGGNLFHQRNQDGYEFAAFSDDEVEDEAGYFAVKPVPAASFVIPDEAAAASDVEEASYDDEEEDDDDEDDDDDEEEEESSYATPASESSGGGGGGGSSDEEEIIAVDTETSSYDSETDEAGPTSGIRETSALAPNIDNHRQGR